MEHFSTYSEQNEIITTDHGHSIDCLTTTDMGKKIINNLLNLIEINHERRVSLCALSLQMEGHPWEASNHLVFGW